MARFLLAYVVIVALVLVVATSNAATLAPVASNPCATQRFAEAISPTGYSTTVSATGSLKRVKCPDNANCVNFVSCSTADKAAGICFNVNSTCTTPTGLKSRCLKKIDCIPLTTTTTTTKRTTTTTTTKRTTTTTPKPTTTTTPAPCIGFLEVANATGYSLVTSITGRLKKRACSATSKCLIYEQCTDAEIRTGKCFDIREGCTTAAGTVSKCIIRRSCDQTVTTTTTRRTTTTPKPTTTTTPKPTTTTTPAPCIGFLEVANATGYSLVTSINGRLKKRACSATSKCLIYEQCTDAEIRTGKCFDIREGCTTAAGTVSKCIIRRSCDQTMTTTTTRRTTTTPKPTTTTTPKPTTTTTPAPCIGFLEVANATGYSLVTSINGRLKKRACSATNKCVIYEQCTDAEIRTGKCFDIREGCATAAGAVAACIIRRSCDQTATTTTTRRTTTTLKPTTTTTPKPTTTTTAAPCVGFLEVATNTGYQLVTGPDGRLKKRYCSAASKCVIYEPCTDPEIKAGRCFYVKDGCTTATGAASACISQRSCDQTVTTTTTTRRTTTTPKPTTTTTPKPTTTTPSAPCVGFLEVANATGYSLVTSLDGRLKKRFCNATANKCVIYEQCTDVEIRTGKCFNIREGCTTTTTADGTVSGCIIRRSCDQTVTTTTTRRTTTTPKPTTTTTPKPTTTTTAEPCIGFIEVATNTGYELVTGPEGRLKKRFCSPATNKCVIYETCTDAEIKAGRCFYVKDGCNSDNGACITRRSCDQTVTTTPKPTTTTTPKPTTTTTAEPCIGFLEVATNTGYELVTGPEGRLKKRYCSAASKCVIYETCTDAEIKARSCFYVKDGCTTAAGAAPACITQRSCDQTVTTTTTRRTTTTPKPTTTTTPKPTTTTTPKPTTTTTAEPCVGFLEVATNTGYELVTGPEGRLKKRFCNANSKCVIYETCTDAEIKARSCFYVKDGCNSDNGACITRRSCDQTATTTTTTTRRTTTTPKPTTTTTPKPTTTTTPKPTPTTTSEPCVGFLEVATNTGYELVTGPEGRLKKRFCSPATTKCVVYETCTDAEIKAGRCFYVKDGCNSDNGACITRRSCDATDPLPCDGFTEVTATEGFSLKFSSNGPLQRTYCPGANADGTKCLTYEKCGDEALRAGECFEVVGGCVSASRTNPTCLERKPCQ